MPNLYIIAGCNGAGKTTASYTVLPEMLGCKEFVNADEIARGLSPFQPEQVAIEAGKIMLHRINDLIALNADFAFETTLTTRSYVNTIKEARLKNYFVTLVFFSLDSPELAVDRVRNRVKEGGHNIPEEVIRRRYNTGMANLFNLFIPICDYWMLFNNSNDISQIIAEGSTDLELKIYNQDTFNKIKKYCDGK